MSANERESEYPICGCVFGELGRPMVPVVVCRGQHKVNAHFVIGTSFTHSYVSVEVMQALGLNDYLPDTFHVKLNGVDVPQCHLTYAAMDRVNVLGADFLQASKCKLDIDYSSKTVKLIQQLPEEPQR